MKQAISSKQQWLKVLGKGMVTIPKTWRDELGFGEGDIIRAKKTGNSLVLEPIKKVAPYRVYSQKELERFVKDDELLEKERLEIDKKLKV